MKFSPRMPAHGRHSVPAYAALAAVALLGSSAFADYSVTNTFDLAPAGINRSQAFAVSAAFQAGTGIMNITSLNSALLWNSNNSPLNLTPAGYETGRFLGSDGLHLVGSGSSLANTGNQTQALLWNGTTGSFTNLNPAGYVASYADGVLGNQQVGAATTSAGPIQNFHAAVWTSTAASFVDLNPAGYLQSVATGTNGTQQIGYGGGDATGDKVHALLWNGSSSFTDLTPAGYDYAYGESIGKTQQVGYGGSALLTGSRDNALLWTGTASSFVNLNPTGYLSSVANATNDFQQVGYGFGPSDTSNSHALLWNGAADVNVDLHMLLPGSPTSSVATAIDPWGNVSGYAVYSGFNHAVTWLAGDVFKGPTGASAWNSAANWTSGVPIATNDVLVISSDGNSRTINFTNANPALAFNKLTVDSLNGPAITLNQSQDALNADTETIGLVGAGALTQSGGTHTVTTITLGARVGSSGTYSLSGTGSLTAAGMSFLRGTYNQSGGTAVTSGLTFGSGFNFNLSGGTFQVPALILSTGPNFNWTGGTLSLTNTSPNSNIIGTTTFTVPAAGTLMTARSFGTSLTTLTVNGKAQFLPTASTPINSVTKVSTLTIAGTTNAWTGQVDLANNALIIQTSGGADKTTKLANLINQVGSGRNGGLWTGNGVTSSTILSTPNTSLAVVDNNDLHLTTYRTLGVTDNSLIVVQAHNGDATLDNKVDSFDLNVLAGHWQMNVPGSGLVGTATWSSGDFTGDGKVDSFDLNVLAANWQFAGSLEAALAGFPQFNAVAVPEPASLAVLALGAGTLAARRRRRV